MSHTRIFISKLVWAWLVFPAVIKRVRLFFFPSGHHLLGGLHYHIHLQITYHLLTGIWQKLSFRKLNFDMFKLSSFIFSYYIVSLIQCFCGEKYPTIYMYSLYFYLPKRTYQNCRFSDWRTAYYLLDLIVIKIDNLEHYIVWTCWSD